MAIFRFLFKKIRFSNLKSANSAKWRFPGCYFKNIRFSNLKSVILARLCFPGCFFRNIWFSNFQGGFRKYPNLKPKICNFDQMVISRVLFRNIRILSLKSPVLAKWRFLGCFSQISELQSWNLQSWPSGDFLGAFSKISESQTWNLLFWPDGVFRVIFQKYPFLYLCGSIDPLFKITKILDC